MIKRFILNQSDLEIGVFLPSQKLQVKYFNKLLHRLKDVQGVKVQRYTSGDKVFGDASTLEFDRPGVVTVLCDSNCKGLEFDAVFIPELQARRWDQRQLTTCACSSMCYHRGLTFPKDRGRGTEGA